MDIKYFCTGDINNEQFNYAVICATYKGKWIFVRNKDRETWEMPAGHREYNEDIGNTAKRELFEETGALNYEIETVCDYSVTVREVTTYGRLFYAKINKLSPLSESEIGEIRSSKLMPEKLTYPEILPELQKRVLRHLAEKTLGLLEKDKPRNINMINFIKNYPVNTIDTAGCSVLIRGRSDEDWVYISSDSKAEFRQLTKEVLDEEDKCFAILEDWMLPYIVNNKKIRSRLTSMKLVYDAGYPSLPVRSAIVRLIEADAPYIYENSKYKEYISVEYIKERINNGIGLGIYENGRLVAWALTHDDGAIGFMNVLEQYRGRGYATDVTSVMIMELLKLGEMPFVHIEEHNQASLNLAKKAGFRIDRRIHWFKFC